MEQTTKAAHRVEEDLRQRLVETSDSIADLSSRRAELSILLSQATEEKQRLERHLASLQRARSE
jgi:hypothetical protein